MKILLFVTLTSAFVGCNSGKKVITTNVLGDYRSTGDYLINSEIGILSNNIYKYQWSTGMNGGNSSGKWQFKDGILVLNSDLQPNFNNTTYYTVLEENAVPEDVVSVKVVDSEGVPIPFLNCTIVTSKGVTNGDTTEDGLFVYSTDETVDKIILSFVGFKTVEYKPKGSFNNFKILWREEHEEYEFFTNEKLNVKKSKIILRDQNGKKQIYNRRE